MRVCKNVSESMRVWECVCVSVSESVCVCVNESVCVWEIEWEYACVSVCECVCELSKVVGEL